MLRAARRSMGVSPAPAGIHPRIGDGGRLWRRLPRTRGDPPCLRRSRPSLSTSPPHPRGSTLGRLSFGLFCRVSPAPAGIHPDLKMEAKCRAGLPRTRGDPPWRKRRNRKRRKSPPHPRGSTPGDRAERRMRRVSPAPAGIHPASPTRSRISRCLPRTRGDPPSIRAGRGGGRRSPPHPRGSTLAWDGCR